MIDIKSTQSRRVRSTFESIYRRGFDWKLMLVGVAIVFFCQFVMLPNAESEDGAMPRNARMVLILGFFAVAISAYFFSNRLRLLEWSPTLPDRLRFNVGAERSLMFGIGVAALALLSLRLLSGSNAGSDIWIWFVAIAGCSIPFAPSLNRVLVGLRRAFRAIRRRDLAIVGTLVIAFTALNLADLSDWYYAAVGDEYAVWEFSEHFAKDGITRPFGQDGVYDHHPRLGFALKSLTMKVVGIDYFGWKSSSIFLVALTIPAVYWLGTLLRDRVTGAVAATMIASSHYVFALSHAGINSLDSLFPSVYAMSFFVLGTRSKSPLLLFFAGVIAGTCFYVNYSARIIMPIMVIFLVLQAWPRFSLRSSLPLVVGFAVAALPLVIVNGTEVVTSMLTVAIGGQPETIDKTFIERIQDNILLNLYAFNFNERSSHYISGSLMDPVSAAIAVTAVGFAVGRYQKPTSRLLLLWLLIGFAATALASPYWHTAVTRLYPLLIPLSLMVGIFISAFIWPIDIKVSSLSSRGVLLHPKTVVIVAIVAIGLSVWLLNIQRFKYETPEIFHVHPTPVSIGAMESPQCNQFPSDRIAFAGNDLHLLRRVLNSYNPGSITLTPDQQPEVPGSPKFFDYQQVRQSEMLDSHNIGCIIFANPHQSEQIQTLGHLSESYPQGRLARFSDHSGKTTISIFKLP